MAAAHWLSPSPFPITAAPNRADVIVKQMEPLKDALGEPAKVSQSTESLLYAVSHWRRSPVTMATSARQ